jgi:hypothetical protein
MTKWVIGTVVLTLMLVTTLVEKRTAESEFRGAVSDAEIGEAIRDLASQSSDHSFEVFYKNPEEATKLLIAALKPIKRGHYPNGKRPQAVWIVRALRSLTGLDFKAATRARLTDDEAHFLRENEQDEVEFFGTWMSRDSDRVAPKDAQVAIIKKWQEWYARNGHTYNYVNDRELGDWYF